MALSIDYREKDLIKQLQCWNPTVASLAVGDVVCTYGEGRGWVAERKTADDLARSIMDGRWADQTARLMSSGYSNVFFIVEGSLAATTLPHETLIGACLTSELRDDSHLIRTACVEETSMLL